MDTYSFVLFVIIFTLSGYTLSVKWQARVRNKVKHEHLETIRTEINFLTKQLDWLDTISGKKYSNLDREIRDKLDITYVQISDKIDTLEAQYLGVHAS